MNSIAIIIRQRKQQNSETNDKNKLRLTLIALYLIGVKTKL
jgi:hypothetical protein